MGASVKCPKCGFQDRYDSSEIINIGTSYIPQFEVNCHKCNSPITSKEIVEPSKPKYLFNKKTKSELITEISTLLGQKKLPEIILQDYLNKEFKQYGFTDIEGPFNKGPDFKVFLDGKCKWLEVETDAINYKKHGHHLSKKFDKVEILFYLYDYSNDNKYHHILPQVHIKANVKHFKDWFYEKIDQKYYVQNIMERFNAIYNEYARHYLNEFCDKRDEDMAICPNCDSCAYKNEEWLIDCTNRFISTNPDILHSDKYDFNKVTFNKLHEIFN